MKISTRLIVLLSSILVLLIGALFVARDIVKNRFVESDSILNSSVGSIKNIQYKKLDGVDNNLLSLDLYLPETNQSKPLPLIIYVHGGAWSVGDKANNINTKANYFTGQGFAFASVNYRLTSVRESDNQIQFPTHAQDVASSIKYLSDNSGDYNIDTNKISLIGHSAGANIVSTIGTNNKYFTDQNLNPENLVCIISNDTEAYNITKLINDTKRSNNVYTRAFGNNQDIWQQASPTITIQNQDHIPEFFIITRGDSARVEQSTDFANKISNAQIIKADPLTHIEVNEYIGLDSDNIITPKITEFLKKCT